MTSPTETTPTGGVLRAPYTATTIGMFSLIVFVAFESMAVTTVMPDVARLLDGVDLYALAFAAPMAIGVVGMVAAGMWSDRRGPVAPLVASLTLFSAGLAVCGLAPSMEVLLLGRGIQGLGGGALMVGLYVVVGLTFPARLQPAVFASFAAAWVLPSLFGPALAAYVADLFGWRWVFLGAVVFVAVAGLMIAPTLRRLEPPPVPEGPAVPLSRLVWATAAAGAVLAVELVGSAGGWPALGAVVAVALLVVALRPLLPVGTLRAARGLPSVIGLRGLVSGAFFTAEAYIVFVLQDHWGLTAKTAGLALTGVGLSWALASWGQSRLSTRVDHAAAMRIGTSVVAVCLAVLWVVVRMHEQLPAGAAIATYVVAGLGMGFCFPRLGVATLAASTDVDRGFNSSALTISDVIGAALSLSFAGVAFAAAERADADPFLAVYSVGLAIGLVAVVVSRRADAVPAPA